MGSWVNCVPIDELIEAESATMIGLACAWAAPMAAAATVVLVVGSSQTNLFDVVQLTCPTAQIAGPKTNGTKSNSVFAFTNPPCAVSANLGQRSQVQKKSFFCLLSSRSKAQPH